MRIRELLGGAALATTLLCSAGADATLIDLGGYTGPISIKLNNYESFSSTTIAPGVTNFGVVGITSINDPNNNLLWFAGKSGQFLSAVFDGITVSSVTPIPGGFRTTNTGGTFHVWLNSTNFNPGQGTAGYGAAGCPVGGLCYNGITNVGGLDILDFNLVPGTTADPTNTLDATITSNTVPLSGHAEGFADITGGADAAEFGRGGFTTLFAPADLHFLDNFCGNIHDPNQSCAGPFASDWQNFSQDPLTANAVLPTPEPASLALLGTALLGFGSWARRRRNRRPS